MKIKLSNMKDLKFMKCLALHNLYCFLFSCRCSIGHLDIQVFSSKENVSVTVNGKLVSM